MFIASLLTSVFQSDLSRFSVTKVSMEILYIVSALKKSRSGLIEEKWNSRPNFQAIFNRKRSSLRFAPSSKFKCNFERIACICLFFSLNGILKTFSLCILYIFNDFCKPYGNKQSSDRYFNVINSENWKWFVSVFLQTFSKFWLGLKLAVNSRVERWVTGPKVWWCCQQQSASIDSRSWHFCPRARHLKAVDTIITQNNYWHKLFLVTSNRERLMV